MEVVRLSDPIPIVQYTLHNDRAQKLPHFAWVQEYLNDANQFTNLVCAHKAKVTNGPKFKFGIQVPHNQRHALALNNEQGNNAWKQAIDTKIQAITDMQVFWLPTLQDDLGTYTRIPTIWCTM